MFTGIRCHDPMTAMSAMTRDVGDLSLPPPPAKMTSVTYSPAVLDHFEHPRNVGDLPGADAEVRLEHPVCGDIMKLAVKLSDGRIGQVRYRTQGCVAAVAAGSCLTEMIGGKSVMEARALRREQLLEALGGLPNASMHATHLAMDALQQVLGKLKEIG